MPQLYMYITLHIMITIQYECRLPSVCMTFVQSVVCGIITLISSKLPLPHTNTLNDILKHFLRKDINLEFKKK